MSDAKGSRNEVGAILQGVDENETLTTTATGQAATIEGKLASLVFRAARLHLREDLSARSRRDQINKTYKRMYRLLDRLDALRHPGE